MKSSERFSSVCNDRAMVPELGPIPNPAPHNGGAGAEFQAWRLVSTAKSTRYHARLHQRAIRRPEPQVS
jgi:hypothetical protein